jgi:hypothetical protein
MVKQLAPQSGTTRLSGPGLSTGRTVVFETTAEVAEQLAHAIADDPGWRGIVLEDDPPLTFGAVVRSSPFPSVLSSAALHTSMRVTVLGRNDEPVSGAVVTALGRLGPASAVTGREGTVELALFDEQTPASLEALYVRPHAD